MWFVLIFGIVAIVVYELATKIGGGCIANPVCNGNGNSGCYVGTPVACFDPGSKSCASPYISCDFEAAIEANCQTIASASQDVANMNQNITNDPATWPTGDRIWDICRAIAKQEGYSRGPGAAPYNLNNPGDLSPGDEHGRATAGTAEWHGGSYVIHFATAYDGWMALYAKVTNIVLGNSRTYSQQWSIRQIGAKWAGDPGWPNGVARNLGVNPDSDGFYSYVQGGN